MAEVSHSLKIKSCNKEQNFQKTLQKVLSTRTLLKYNGRVISAFRAICLGEVSAFLQACCSALDCAGRRKSPEELAQRRH